MSKPQIGILMGSDSDMKVMSGATKILDGLKIPYEVSILSAHRAPEETAKYAKVAKDKGLKVIIAGAGGAAALPGTIAALTSLPVIGVPIETQALEGVDSLYSMVSMPPGVPVATVGINNAKNAAILACQIIGLQDPKVMQKISTYKSTLKKEVLAKNDRLQKIGLKKYLKSK